MLGFLTGAYRFLSRIALAARCSSVSGFHLLILLLLFLSTSALGIFSTTRRYVLRTYVYKNCTFRTTCTRAPALDVHRSSSILNRPTRYDQSHDAQSEYEQRDDHANHRITFTVTSMARHVTMTTIAVEKNTV